jgi:hypothetical protein
MNTLLFLCYSRIVGLESRVELLHETVDFFYTRIESVDVCLTGSVERSFGCHENILHLGDLIVFRLKNTRLLRQLRLEIRDLAPFSIQAFSCSRVIATVVWASAGPSRTAAPVPRPLPEPEPSKTSSTQVQISSGAHISQVGSTTPYPAFNKVRRRSN